MLQSARIRLDLIRTEIDVGLTFAQIALQSATQLGKRIRNTRNARTAYDAVVRMMSNAAMNDGTAEDLLGRLATLRNDLAALGEGGL
jgi:hypothetical protein